ncbi:hypothetical protein ABE438_16105 [Bosea sp. TWI1241]|uniref:hypothetical protein n=1 Tax=Bosea sp. TWI1241 TaxID=3148904 RepID=UPI0032092917
MSAIFRGMKAEERAAIVKGMRARAFAAGLSENQLWQAAIDFWAPAAIVTPASLVADAIKFAGLLNNAPNVSPPASAHRPQKRRARLRKPRAMKGNENGLDYWSRATAAAVFDAASALPQLFGVHFNVLIVLRHDLLDCDEAHGAIEASDLIHEAAQQFRRLAGVQARLHSIYRHRKTDRDGFTTAIICHIPPLWADAMRDWVDGFIERRFGTRRDRRAVHIRMTEHPDMKGQVRRHWRLVRGLAGALDPTLEIVHEGRRRWLVDLLGVPRALRRPGQALSLAQRYRISETIGASAQARARRERLACLSAFRDQAWGALTTGWELAGHNERLRELDERDQKRAVIMAHWPKGRDPLHDEVRASELERLRSSWPEDPRQRPRAWRGWWLPREL